MKISIASQRLILLLIVISLVVRIFIAFGTGLGCYSVDSVNYINQAKALIAGNYLNYFPNGYPFIIAFTLLIDSFIRSEVFLILLNIALSSASVYLVYIISFSMIGNAGYSLIAAAVAAFYPNQLNYVRFILTEVPAAFFLILTLFLFIKEKNILSGLSLGFAAIIKSSLLPVAFLFSVYLFIKSKYIAGFKFLILSLVPLLIMLIYGYSKTGEWIIGKNFANLLYFSSGVDSPDNLELQEAVKVYLDSAIKDPGNFLKERIISLWYFWGFLPPEGEGLRNSIFFRLLIGLRFLLVVLASYGFFYYKKNDVAIFLILPLIVLTIIHTLTYSEPRYTFPAEPFLIVLAVAALKLIKEKSFIQNSTLKIQN